MNVRWTFGCHGQRFQHLNQRLEVSGNKSNKKQVSLARNFDLSDPRVLFQWLCVNAPAAIRVREFYSHGGLAKGFGYRVSVNRGKLVAQNHVC